MSEAFYQLYRDLDREGPGEAADVDWAVAQVKLPDRPAICDLGCGSGADVAALLAACPDAHITGIDKQAHFIEQAKARVGDDPRVDMRVGDLADPGGRYDLIWCAGAAYFLGITQALDIWREALTPGGVVAFSQICWWVDAPSPAARALWADFAPMTNEQGIRAEVLAAGYEVMATRRLAPDAWQGFYQPLQARIEQLREGANAQLRAVLDEEQAQIATFAAHGDEYGYLLSVVRPV